MKIMKELELFGHVVKIGSGSSTHNPERKGGMSTCDIKTWVCFDGDWFIPNLRSMYSVWRDLQDIENEQDLVIYIELIKEL